MMHEFTAARSPMYASFLSIHYFFLPFRPAPVVPTVPFFIAAKQSLQYQLSGKGDFK